MQTQTKVLFFTALWKRPYITETCFIGLRRIMSKMNAEALAVLSEDSMIPLCEKYGIKWVKHANQPLGRKKNFGLKHALQMDWEFLIELGSDDLFSDKVVDFYNANFHRPYFGFNKVAYIDFKTKACREFTVRSVFGLGRAIRRDVVEKNAIKPNKIELWRDDLMRAMDKSSNYQIEVYGKTMYESVEVDEPLGIDIKSDVNIWPFNPTIGEPYDIEKLLSNVSEEERERILCLQPK